MDNLEELWCHITNVEEKQYGAVKQASFLEGFACLVTDDAYLCINEKEKLETVLTRKIEEAIGSLKYAQYMSKDLIFWASDRSLGIVHCVSLQSNIYNELDKPVVALAWNPTQTIVVIINSEDEVFNYAFTGSSFQVKNTAHLNAKVPDSVYVGWGSEDTQFRGPKARKNKETKEHIEVKRVVDSGAPQISWRRNGEMFAVNFYKDGNRFIKVFDKDLNPLFQSEEYLNLSNPVSFMGQGQCIASCTVGNDVNHIVIFEKNCMVKNTFEVPENKGDIKQVSYHPKMNMLAVHSLDKSENSYINIYVNSNARWYLKQQLFYPPTRKVHGFEWMNPKENLNTFCEIVVFTSKHIEYHTLRFVINRCRRSTSALVVDGRSVNFYAFDNKNVPPPFSMYSLKFERPVNRILFHPEKPIYVFVNALLQVTVVEWSNEKKLVSLLESDTCPMTHVTCFVNVIFFSNEVKIHLESDSKQMISSTKRTDGFKVHVESFRKTVPLCILSYNDVDCATTYKTLTEEFRKLIYLTKCDVDDHVEFEIALSTELDLFVNDQVVCKGVTSIFVFQDYFVFTHINGNLYCINLQQNYSLLFNSLDLGRIFSREIEQGARILSNNNSMPPEIILILPRGNLESITCRLITIDIVEKLLSDNKWEEAINIMRDARVSWNVLIDLNPERFDEHIPEFVASANKCTMLSTIVNEFDNTENCFRTTYKYCIPSSSLVKCDKIGIIKKILQHLIAADCVENLLCIVAIQQKHISVLSALSSIRDVFLEDPNTYESICKKALNHLLLQENLIEILNAAYSFYNLEFLDFVYSNSGEDPMVYEPEIGSLRELPEIERRFQMNLKGNNAKSAVKYLLRCENLEETYLTDFILKHNVQGVAYNGLQNYHKHFKAITKLYARQLAFSCKYIEAGLVLKRASMFSEALDEFKKALEWREVIPLMKVLGFEDNKKKEILETLSEELLKQQRIDEAIMLLEHYNKDPKKAVQVLVAHKVFRKAIFVAKVQPDDNIDVENEILTPLKQYIVVVMDKIKESGDKFASFANRLQQVRNEKKLKFDSDSGAYDGPDDMYSETGSTSSQGSRSSSRSRGSTASSKNRRKEARKKIDLREGGYYEDIALIRALYITIIDVFGMGSEVRELCLIQDHGDIELSRTLHEKLATLQEIIKLRIPEIWSPEFAASSDSADSYTMAVIQNKEDLDPVYCKPPLDELLEDTWKLAMFSQC